METPIKMDDLGVLLFLETPIYSIDIEYYQIFRLVCQIYLTVLTVFVPGGNA